MLCIEHIQTHINTRAKIYYQRRIDLYWYALKQRFKKKPLVKQKKKPIEKENRQIVQRMRKRDKSYILTKNESLKIYVTRARAGQVLITIMCFR